MAPWRAKPLIQVVNHSTQPEVEITSPETAGREAKQPSNDDPPCVFSPVAKHNPRAKSGPPAMIGKHHSVREKSLKHKILNINVNQKMSQHIGQGKGNDFERRIPS